MSIQNPIPPDQIPVPKSDPETIDIFQRFPKMKPVKSAPILFTLNGCGLSVYGTRDNDALTGTYVTTRFLCIVFIPVFPLDAYRVCDSGNGGWYFLGKDRLGTFSRFWQKAVVGCIIFFVGSVMWQGHLNSPDYRAKQATEEAENLVKQGRNIEAAQIYKRMIDENIGSKNANGAVIIELLKKEIDSGDVSRCSAAIYFYQAHKNKLRIAHAGFPDFAEQVIAAANKFDNPADAESILSVLKPEANDLAWVYAIRKPLLEKLYVLKPEVMHYRIDLALIREAVGELEGALELLEPAADKLGSGESARLYGHLLVESGRETEALPHLERYVSKRSVTLKQAEKSLEQTYQRSRKAELDKLNQTGGPPGFMARYDAASENEQIEMVETYLAERIEKDGGMIAARTNYENAVAILPSIMELGIAYLRAAQSEIDSTKRTEYLDKAEKTLLLMSGSAGDTDDYKFFLGQVYFWSGREVKGRELFDQILTSNKRNVSTISTIAEVYRKLGENHTAKKLLEEAFPKVTNDMEKSGIVQTLSLLADTTDEKIEWLSKGPSNDPWIKVNLAQSRAEKAEKAGNVKDAVRYYQEALNGYGKLGRTSTVLNNSSLIYNALYRVEGKAEHFEKSANLMSEALELEPANSILTFNSASTLSSVAVLHIVKDRIDPKLLQYGLGIESLRFLYQNESEKRELIDQLLADPNFRTSIKRFWEALLLAPKNKNIYSWGASVFYYIDDVESLRRLQKMAAEQDFDFSSEIEQYEKYINKERDDEISESLKSSLSTVESLMADISDSRAKAMAQGYLASVRLAGFSTGDSTEVDKWINDLKLALEEVPCSHLCSVYQSSLEIRALEKLSIDVPECSEIIKTNRRHLDTGDLLRLLVRAKGDLGERIRKHPLVIEAREESIVTYKKFPSKPGVDEWLLLEGYKPDLGSDFSTAVKNNESERLVHEIAFETNFESPSVLISKFWIGRLLGEEAVARAAHEKLVKAGIIMPDVF